ncbi:type II toxin-antitoxin system PemK/MazF family toxin [Nocardia asteroides]
MVSAGTALRGEVWSCALPQPVGPHPVVVLTVNRIAEPLAAVTVVLITGTSGPEVTHVPVGPDSGSTKYEESYVNCADLHTVAKPRLRRKLGVLAPVELRRVESSVRLILGLQP